MSKPAQQLISCPTAPPLSRPRFSLFFSATPLLPLMLIYIICGDDHRHIPQTIDPRSSSDTIMSSASPQPCCTPPEVALSSSSSSSPSILTTQIPCPSEDRDQGDGEECRTPTAEECKIPPVTSCPPPPKKRRVVLLHRCRRRLFHADLIRIDSREIDRLFRPICGGKRKRCYFDGDE